MFAVIYQQLQKLQKPRGGAKRVFHQAANTTRITVLDLNNKKGRLTHLKVGKVGADNFRVWITVDGVSLLSMVGVNSPTSRIDQFYPSHDIYLFQNRNFETYAEGGRAQFIDISFKQSLKIEFQGGTTGDYIQFIYEEE